MRRAVAQALKESTPQACAAAVRRVLPLSMRYLSVHEPWASEIIAGKKPIEQRTWKTNYRGPLAIHAAKRGVLLGTVELYDVVRVCRPLPLATPEPETLPKTCRRPWPARAVQRSTLKTLV